MATKCLIQLIESPHSLVCLTFIAASSFAGRCVNIQIVSLSSWTSEMWMALGADPIVASQIIEMVIEKLVVMAPYVDKKESMMRGGATKVATSQPLAVSRTDSSLTAMIFPHTL